MTYSKPLIVLPKYARVRAPKRVFWARLGRNPCKIRTVVIFDFPAPLKAWNCALNDLRKSREYSPLLGVF